MDPSTIDVGWLSILPPIIAIGLALITKEVISSLLIGILTGAFIYSFSSGTGIMGGLQTTFGTISSSAGNVDSFNIILFLALLGALVYVVNMAGGSKAYGGWASSKLKSRKGALLATAGLGCLIFIDDYFNCLTVGTVMKPITDKHNISRAKLAYIIDATAAPVCIIAPISSWAAAVGSNLVKTGKFGDSGLSAFIQSIPYNFYAILALIMVAIICLTKIDFGPMVKSEKKALNGDIGAIDAESSSQMKISEKGKVYDLIIPIAALIIFSVLAMLHSGGFFSGNGISIADAFGDCNSSASLVLGGFGALVVAFIQYLPRRLLTFREFMDGIGEGIKSMVPAYIILTLAWSISAVCRDLLGAGQFVGSVVEQSHMPLMIIPAIVFLIAAFLSFSTGTAWGTFGILIPIVVVVCSSASSELLIAALAATLAGSVFGDHCSPISDTTILSSTGAGVNHLEHVSTQLPYALTVAANSFIGYVIFGLTQNLIISLSAAIIMLVATIIILGKYYSKKYSGISEDDKIILEVNK